MIPSLFKEAAHGAVHLSKRVRRAIVDKALERDAIRNPKGSGSPPNSKREPSINMEVYEG